MRPAVGPLTADEQAAIDRLAAMPDDQIDYSDIPEIRDWSGAQRGRFHRPHQDEAAGQAVTVHLDVATLAWFRDHAGGEAGVDAAIAAVLRRFVAAADQR